MDLVRTFPAALDIPGDDLGAPSILRLLGRWPTANQLATASNGELIEFARANHHGCPERLAERVTAALQQSNFVARPPLVRAKADGIRLAATQLLLIGQQRKLWERRMGELLLGARRYGRDRQLKVDDLGEKFHDGEI